MNRNDWTAAFGAILIVSIILALSIYAATKTPAPEPPRFPGTQFFKHERK